MNYIGVIQSYVRDESVLSGHNSQIQQTVFGIMRDHSDARKICNFQAGHRLLAGWVLSDAEVWACL